MQKYLLIPLCALVWYACGDIDQKDCAMAVCSEQANTVFLHVRDTLQQPVALDTFKLVNMLDRTPVVIPHINAEMWATMRATGDYVFLTDAFVAGHENTRVVIEFTGIRGQQTLFQRAVTFDIDCCHISPVYGELTVVVN
ncbi:MAG: hypothetical protein LBS12_04640 [Prevotellaceae bacterium]|nr:hypothetical protein [Prevotellaceae bacterium]